MVAIKKNESNLLVFKSETTDTGMSGQAKVMHLGDSIPLDKAVYLWLKQKHMDGIPVSRPMLCEKVIAQSSKCMPRTLNSMQLNH